jgi:transcriptional regulator with XRE-family HTH domain
MPQLSIEAARVNAGLTQKEAAEKLEVSTSTLSKWENSKSYPNAKQIKKIENVYGVKFDTLFFK